MRLPVIIVIEVSIGSVLVIVVCCFFVTWFVNDVPKFSVSGFDVILAETVGVLVPLLGDIDTDASGAWVTLSVNALEKAGDFVTCAVDVSGTSVTCSAKSVIGVMVVFVTTVTEGSDFPETCCIFVLVGLEENLVPDINSDIVVLDVTGDFVFFSGAIVSESDDIVAICTVVMFCVVGTVPDTFVPITTDVIGVLCTLSISVTNGVAEVVAVPKVFGKSDILSITDNVDDSSDTSVDDIVLEGVGLDRSSTVVDTGVSVTLPIIVFVEKPCSFDVREAADSDPCSVIDDLEVAGAFVTDLVVSSLEETVTFVSDVVVFACEIIMVVVSDSVVFDLDVTGFLVTNSVVVAIEVTL